MHIDEEGFSYPYVDNDQCINCGLCEKVCPVINQSEKREPLVVWAAKNCDNSQRMDSSSGGVFIKLATKVIDAGGVVIGAAFDQNFNLKHEIATDIDGVRRFMGSKYLQSSPNHCYQQTEKYLKEGRTVLYSGTPCQVAGLHRFLRKGYTNLITVDCICHGVPSPGVFNAFVRDEILRLEGKQTEIPECFPLPDNIPLPSNCVVNKISFRDKSKGWKMYHFLLDISFTSNKGHIKRRTRYIRVDKNPFMDGFLHDLYLRPSCYECPAKSLSSGADITLGDFWGVESLHPDFFDNKGISAVTINTQKGQEFLESIGLDYRTSSWTDLVQQNRALTTSVRETPKRALFWQNDHKNFADKVKPLCKRKISARERLHIIIENNISLSKRIVIRQFLKRIGVRR